MSSGRRRLKRLAVVALSIAVVLTFSVPAFAAESAQNTAQKTLSQTQQQKLSKKYSQKLAAGKSIKRVPAEAKAAESFASIDKTRISMTEKQEINVTFKLPAGSDLSKLEWYFGDKKFSDDAWQSWIPIDPNKEDGPCEPIFEVKSINQSEDGTVSATISVNYAFDGGDAAYWRPWYAYRGVYALTVKDPAGGDSFSDKIRYEVYDSYTPYNELDSTIENIIANKKNDIYMSWESIGKSTDGKDVNVAIVAKNKSDVDKYLELKKRMESDPDQVLSEVKAGTLNYKVPVYITNIHANECPGVDAQIQFLKDIANKASIPYKSAKDKESEYKISDILNDVFFIVRPTENPYALENYQRGNVYGFDLNRDSTLPDPAGVSGCHTGYCQVGSGRPMRAPRLYI